MTPTRNPPAIMATVRVENTVVLHLIFVVALGFGLLASRKLIEPTREWVPCQDPSISLPFKRETITTAHIAAYICLIPPLVILIIEFLRWRLDEVDWMPVEAATLCGIRVPKLVQCLYMAIGNFLYGAALTIMTVEFGKKTVGRLRPHFYDACKPTNFAQVCDPSKINQYTMDLVCANAKAEIVARESFPSAHSAAAFYIATFLLFYLQSRMSWRSTVLPIVRASIQFVFIQMAIVIALTRVRDHYHFYSDIAVGAVIGIVGALVTVCFMSPVLRGKAVSRSPRPSAQTGDESPSSSSDDCTSLRAVTTTTTPAMAGKKSVAADKSASDSKDLKLEDAEAVMSRGGTGGSPGRGITPAAAGAAGSGDGGRGSTTTTATLASRGNTGPRAPSVIIESIELR